MMNGFYWIYLAMFGMMFWYDFAKTAERKRLIYWGACGFLLLIFSLQDFSVSVDTAEYMRQYEIIPELSAAEMLRHKFEIGYVLLCRGLAFLFQDRRILLLVMGCLILIPFSRSFEQETKAPMVAWMAFLALGMFQHAIIYWRQLAAMAILTFSYRFIRQRKLGPFLLVVLLAMTFHKMSAVFVIVYFIYALPVNKWLLFAGIGIAILAGCFCEPIMTFILTYVYEYHPMYHIRDGGETLLVVLWILTLLSYWILKDRMNDGRVRLAFIMLLIAAVLQPVCFAFYNWLRVVLFFRIALVPICAELYDAFFCHPDGNPVVSFIQKRFPRLFAVVWKHSDIPWFQVATQLLLFAFLFLWYASELDGAVYHLAPLG